MTETTEGNEFYDDGYDEDDSSLNDRIHFSHELFYGRQGELEELTAIYEGLCSKPCCLKGAERDANANAAVSLVLIAGYSGTGKSSLVARFASELEEKSREGKVKPFFFLEGKYEELQRADVPFSAISEAFNWFSSSLLEEGNEAELERVRASINSAIGGEINALTTLVPALMGVLGNTHQESLSESKEHAWNRLKYLFQSLFKAICTEHRPVILFLDDVQWADTASLDLIVALLKDKSLKHFMFIAAIRSNEVDKEHPLTKRLESIEKSGREIQRIDLLNLSMGEIAEFVADTLKLEADESQSLAQAIYGKTRGNIFFAMQALEELQRNNILYFSLITFRWEWNLKGVDMEAGLSDDVVIAVASKIQSAPEKLQRVLTIAAYTRSIVDRETLQMLMKVDGRPVETEELIKLLDIAVLEGLLSNSVGSRNYKFAHDRIQQAAYSLVTPGDDRDKLKRMIGMQLFELGELDSGEDWMLFVAADHLNSTKHQQSDSLMFARLNLICGERASGLAAYLPASQYLREGLQALKNIDRHWQSHYDLSLRLYRAISDVELCLGNFDLGNDLGQQVLTNAETLQDKLDTYLSLAVAKGRQHRHVEALDLCKVALRLLGDYPKRFLLAQLAVNRLAVKRYFRTHSDVDILLLPRMKNATKLAAMKFYAEICYRAFICGHLLEFMLACLRMLRMTFKFGICGQSANGLAGYSVFLGSTGKQDGALRMARLARQVIDLTKDKKMEAVVLMTISSCIDCWSAPHAKTLETLQRAHKAGMEVGDIESGFRNWFMTNYQAYATGYPLGQVETSGAELVEQLQLYGVDAVLCIVLEIRIPILYLAGRADKPLNWDEIEKVCPMMNDSSDTYRLLCAYLGRLELSIFFRELDVANRIAEKMASVGTHYSSYVCLTHRIYFSGLAASGMARKTGLRKYIKRAHAFATEMRRITRSKGLNALHKALMLEADLLACKSQNVAKIQDAYDEAIASAMKAGHTHLAALGSEIAAEYFVQNGDEFPAGTYFSQARDLYRDWGATAKVEELIATRGAFLATSTEEETTTSSGVHCWVLGDIDESRKTVDLDIFSHHTPRTKLPVSEPREEALSRDRDEISCLTDSTEGGTAAASNTVSLSRSSGHSGPRN
jgi:histidine kinase